METAVVDGNGAETGHIIVTTIGGKNGQPKQVEFHVRCYHANRYINELAVHLILPFLHNCRPLAT